MTRLALLTRHRAVVVTAATMLLWAAGEGIAAAADPDAAGGGVLGPLNMTSSEGVPLERYELDPMEQAQEAQGAPEDQDPGFMPTSTDSIGAIVRNFLASGLFALSRTVTGFACWLIDRVYHFPIIDKLTAPAQRIADAYEQDIIGPLGIAGITLAWAFVFGLVMVMRGKVARGAGELLLSLLISAITATTLVQPAVLLGYEGPVQQTQRAALEAAVITTNAGNAGPKVITGPCVHMHGEARDFCLRQERERASDAAERERIERCEVLVAQAREMCLSGEKAVNPADVSKPITRTLTDTLVVEPYMLLQYGRILEKDDPLYPAHRQLIAPDNNNLQACSKLSPWAKRACEDSARRTNAGLNALEKAGPDGKAAVDRMLEADWDKVLGALLVLIAAIIIVLVVAVMALALIAAQFGCVIAAIGAVAVFPLAILPGPGRGLLWKWSGYLAGSMLVLVTTAIFIPLFGIAAHAVLADSNSALLERLLILDGLVLTSLIMYKRLVRASRAAGAGLARRMSYARIGGSHLMGGPAADTAAAFSALGLGRATGSPAHAAFHSRAGVVSQASPAARGALAPFRLGFAAAHTVLIGPKRPRVEPAAVGPDGKPLPATSATPRKPAVGPDGKPLPATTPRTSPRRTEGAGSDGRPLPQTAPAGAPARGVVPAGARLEAALRTTRSGRALVAASKVAYHSTIGLPAGWNRLARTSSERAVALGAELGRQRRHYAAAHQRWRSDTRAGLGLGRTSRTYPATDPAGTSRRSRSTTRPTGTPPAGDGLFRDSESTSPSHPRATEPVAALPYFPHNNPPVPPATPSVPPEEGS
ncbi:hypothetical protein GCM10017562_01600 [Streptomyces roseofulvus]|uniref:hypothetical protein n=1 Tax=Streptomyces roseofulvus TaxID=33902 RepID=UPI0031F946B3